MKEDVFDKCNQKLESILTVDDKEYISKQSFENVSVNGNVNDSYKHRANFELTESKQHVIRKLKGCTYLTPSIDIARLLEELFLEWPSKQGHWLYISQQYVPRVINRVIARLIKLHASGRITLQNPAAYFTMLIKFRKKRKPIVVNDSC